ncbi:MAG: TIGR02453 family protein [Holophaga sp.]|jgi:uncharacterized protein (TIGR02453 family)
MPQRKGSGADPEASFFTPALFKFLRDLKRHNDREWFNGNKDRFEADVKAPMLRFIGAFAGPLEQLNKNFLADPRPVGGSMFRIHRDTRFARDKSPYKLNVGAHFRHRLCTREVHAPGFYLHLQPGESFSASGLWHPDPDALRQVRGRIVSHAREWKKLREGGIEVQGDTLARVPQGFDPDHPWVDDLRLKDFYTFEPFSDQEVCAPDFLERYAENCRGNLPLMGFLTKAMELPW